MSLTEKYLGKTLKFVSGKFEGSIGQVIEVVFDKNYTYGVYLVVKLLDNRIVHVDKSDHFIILP